ncbi:hypothetical protein [Nonomuraea soli]|uniref:Uncharacterized protein n=1 Tax=Nonomuraea soli TaxID=1032476 RepID=A0A7W0CMX6_9ACTN|nr:hypothetical protein [Nonomuraea soli]MBA2893957.1 hypothetical protein [Nonomuraea soli]
MAREGGSWAAAVLILIVGNVAMNVLVDDVTVELAIVGAILLVVAIGWAVRAQRRGGVRAVVERHRARVRAQLDAMDEANLRRHGGLPFAIWLACVPVFTTMAQAIEESETILRVAVLPVTALMVALPLFEAGPRPWAAILRVSLFARFVVAGTVLWILAFLIVPAWLTGVGSVPYTLAWALGLMIAGFVHAVRSKARLGGRLMPSPWLK